MGSNRPEMIEEIEALLPETASINHFTKEEAQSIPGMSWSRIAHVKLPLSLTVGEIEDLYDQLEENGYTTKLVYDSVVMLVIDASLDAG